MKEILLLAAENDWVISSEWRSRDEMTTEDNLSRVSASSASKAQLPVEFRERLWRDMWNARPELDLFADVTSKMAERYCSRFPDGESIGEGLSISLTGERRVWCFPPFALWRPVLLLLVSMVSPPDLIAVLPDDPIVRFALTAWRLLPGPPYVLMPPDFVRAVPPSVSLLVCVSPSVSMHTSRSGG